MIQTENFEREKNFKEDFLLTRPRELSSQKFFIGRANKKIVLGTTQQISCSVTFKYFFCVDLTPIEQVLKGVVKIEQVLKGVVKLLLEHDYSSSHTLFIQLTYLSLSLSLSLSPFKIHFTPPSPFKSPPPSQHFNNYDLKYFM